MTDLLTGCQANDLYNYLSDEGRKAVEFVDFAAAVRQLEGALEGAPEALSVLQRNSDVPESLRTGILAELARLETRTGVAAAEFARARDVMSSLVESAEARTRRAEAAVGRLEGVIAGLRGDLAEMAETEARLAEARAALAAEADELRAAVATAEARVAAETRKTEASEAQLAAVRRTLAALEQQVEVRESKISSLTTEQRRLTLQIDLERQTSLQLSEKFLHGGEDTEQLVRRSVRDGEQQLAAAESRVSELTSEIEALKTDNARLARLNEKFQAALNEQAGQFKERLAFLQPPRDSSLSKAERRLFLAESASAAYEDADSSPPSPKASLIAPTERFETKSIQSRLRLSFAPRDEPLNPSIPQLSKSPLNLQIALEEDPLPSDSPLIEPVFLCLPKQKKLMLLVLRGRVFYLMESRKIGSVSAEIGAARVSKITRSPRLPQIFSLSYSADSGREATVTLELFSPKNFLRALTSLGLEGKLVVAPLAIEGLSNFANSALPCFSVATRCGLAEFWVNTLMSDWTLVFLLLIEERLLIFHLPENYNYSDYQNVNSRIGIHLLESFNLFTEPANIGLRKQNVFALKLINENKDLIFNCFSAESKAEWAEALAR